MILNLINPAQANSVLSVLLKIAKKPRVAPEMIIPTQHGYCNLDLADNV